MSSALPSIFLKRVASRELSIVRAHACAAGYKKDSAEDEALGRIQGGFRTKIPALTEALGNPLKCIATPGQRQEIAQANAMIV